MVKLKNKGASKILVRGNRYIFPNEVYECSKEEATYRKENTPGLWEDITPPPVVEEETKKPEEVKKTENNKPSATRTIGAKVTK